MQKWIRTWSASCRLCGWKEGATDMGDAKAKREVHNETCPEQIKLKI